MLFPLTLAAMPARLRCRSPSASKDGAQEARAGIGSMEANRMHNNKFIPDTNWIPAEQNRALSESLVIEALLAPLSHTHRIGHAHGESGLDIAVPAVPNEGYKA